MTERRPKAGTRRRTAAMLLASLVAASAAACGKGGANAQASAEGRGGTGGAAGAAGARGPAGAGGPGGAGGARPIIPVEVTAARTQRVEDLITGSGQIEPLQSIELRPEVEGRIVEIYFREGSRVAAGDSLFKVDDAELKVQIVRAEADRDLAIQTLARQRQLMESNSSTTSDLERADAAARAAQASLDLLRLRHSRTVVRAPFSGVTGARTVSLGDYVNNQSRLVTIQTINPQHASLDVPERYAEQLRNGLTVTFRVAALRNREFTGVVDFVDPVVRLPGRTIRIKARVPNVRGELASGMFAEGRLIAAARDNAVVVPEDAILPVQGNTLVFVVNDGKASRRPVEIGLRLPGYVEIVRGVSAGEQVVVGGLERLTDGAPVRATVVERR